MNHTVTFTITAASLPYDLLAFLFVLVAGWIVIDVLAGAAALAGDRFRADWRGRRLVRRWYCTGALVTPDPAGICKGLIDTTYKVQEWQRYDDRDAIWLRVADPEGDVIGDYWVLAAHMRPGRVPVFRPHLCHGLPHLTRYIPAIP